MLGVVAVFCLLCAGVISYIVFRNTSVVEMQVYACGESVEVVDRFGRVGVWGRNIAGIDDKVFVIKSEAEFSLGVIFKALGGELNTQTASIPVVGEMLVINSGEKCGEDISELQVFVLRAENGVIRQAKLDRPATFVPRLADTGIPDCVIVEYGPQQATTNRLCEFMVDLTESGTHTLEIAE